MWVYVCSVSSVFLNHALYVFWFQFFCFVLFEVGMVFHLIWSLSTQLNPGILLFLPPQLLCLAWGVLG